MADCPPASIRAIARRCTTGSEHPELIAIDTSLLVYAHRSRTPGHGRARKAITRAAAADDGWGIAVASLTEFWGNRHASSVGRAPVHARSSRRLLLAPWCGWCANLAARARFWGPSPGVLTDLDVIGARVFDLQIALSAFEGGATDLWTHDARFVKVPGLLAARPSINASAES